jgi:hypothetical protein
MWASMLQLYYQPADGQREKAAEFRSATEEMLDFSNACIRYGVSVCIAGATGSGFN